MKEFDACLCQRNSVIFYLNADQSKVSRATGRIEKSPHFLKLGD